MGKLACPTYFDSIPYYPQYYIGGLLKDVRQLTTSQLEEVKLHLTQPHLEVACTLVYSDRSTQLRNRKVFNHFMLIQSLAMNFIMLKIPRSIMGSVGVWE